VTVINEDLGVSGSGLVERTGFARLTSDVALGHVGIVLGLEVSQLACNNADWYGLFDPCGVTETLIGDADGMLAPTSIGNLDTNATSTSLDACASARAVCRAPSGASCSPGMPGGLVVRWNT